MNKNTLKEALEELASREIQEQLWFGKIPGKMSSFVEVYCRAFDDSQLGREMNTHDFKEKYSSDAVRRIHTLDSLLKQIPPYTHPADIMDLPAMNDVRESARLLLKSSIFDD